MAGPKHPRHHDEAFKRQIVQSCESGKPSREIRAGYDIARSTRGAGFGASATAAPPGPRTTARPGGTSRSSRGGATGGWRWRWTFQNKRRRYLTKAGVIRANASRYPISARCGIPGVPRSTCYWMTGHPGTERADPIAGDVRAVRRDGRERHGARKIKAVLERKGVTASRRRIGKIMREQGMTARTRADGPNRTGRGPTRPGCEPAGPAGPTATPRTRIRRAT